MRSILQQWREQVLAAHAGQRPLCLRGSGSKDWYGQAAIGEPLDTRPYSGIIDYEPTELVITARCGTPLAEIEATLAEQRQMLACEPPHFGAGATLGGMVASGLSGPRRAYAGAVRDFMLGARLMDGAGEVLTFGGQVMKNVAGYDVARLLAGSLGTLGLITEVSLKVLPRPLREASVRFECSEINALARLNTWAGQPLPLSASCWHDGLLHVRLSGAEAAVGAALARLGGEPVADADQFWASLREQRHVFFQDADCVWRLSLPSASGALVLGGQQLIEWGGALRWLKLPSQSDPVVQAATIRRSTVAAGGHATLFRGGDKEVGVFQPLAPALARVHQRLQRSFDPQRLFNPGRMY